MSMTVSAKELRVRAAEVLDAVRDGEVVTVTYRGRPVAKIHPTEQPARKASREDDAFGMWRSRADLKEVRDWVRKGRRQRGARSSSTRTS